MPKKKDDHNNESGKENGAPPVNGAPHVNGGASVNGLAGSNGAANANGSPSVNGSPNANGAMPEHDEIEADLIEPPTPADGRPAGRDDTDVRHLFSRLHGPLEGVRFGDRESLRDHLVLLHAPLVEHCARNFLASGEPLEDLVQEGYVGLIKAVDRFDPEKGVRFSTYACHLITGEIRHYLRDLGRLIHEPGWHFELRQRISRTSDQLAQKLGRAAEPEEIALALNITAQSVRDVLRNQQTLIVEYLDAEGDRDSEDGGPSADWNQRLIASATVSGAAEKQVEDQMMFGLALPQLRELEKKAVTLFFFEDLSKTEIARRLDVSVNHAAYLIKRGVDGLREIINAGDGGLDELDATRHSSAAQSHARAAYLLELARGELETSKGEGGRTGSTRSASRRANRRSTRLVEKLSPSAIPAARTGVASFSEFALWVDEEARRAARYAQEFAVLWLRVENWEEITKNYSDDEKRRAFTSLQALTRRCCRATDKIASLATSQLSGLHLLVLMPHTGQNGHATGERWEIACRSQDILPESNGEGESGSARDNAESGKEESDNVESDNKEVALKTQFAFAVFPRDGRTSDDLFRNIGKQLGA